ncbi:MAG: flagellar biosynthesis protein FlhF [Lachnospiraceae bacterium]|nr:flagellar biosynthesis protein FlhF [Lachnospiraceae bacterium]
MNIKTFKGKTEEEAMELAKKELGEQAVKMASRKVEPKGFFQKLFSKPVWEVTAAVDNPDVYERTIPRKSVQENSEARYMPSGSVVHNSELLFEERKQEGGQNAIEQKLDTLKKLFEEQIREQGQTKGAEEARDKSDGAENELPDKNIAFLRLIFRQLLENDVEEQFANQIITEIETSLKKETDVSKILANIYQKIVLKLGQTKTLEVVSGKTKYIFFIGPTGVGKTTTIAKLAYSLMEQKKAKVALLAADTYRIAAVDQLRTYAEIMNIPLYVIYSETELDEQKQDLEKYDIILVDTAGRSHRNKEQRDDIERLIHSVPAQSREVYLVLSATTKYRDLVKITEAYSEIADYRLIFTKLDETGTIGNIFNIKMLTGAPLSYATNGQNVPDDISRMDPQNVARQLLGGGN